MRLWSLHPKYLDAKGLVALWREGLLAQKVLSGKTKGYVNHPQLIRFRNCRNPLRAIATYLRYVAEEADARGYNFDKSKIAIKRTRQTIPVTDRQVAYERGQLLAKLTIRDQKLYRKMPQDLELDLHPLFREVPGDIESWERV